MFLAEVWYRHRFGFGSRCCADSIPHLYYCVNDVIAIDKNLCLYF